MSNQLPQLLATANTEHGAALKSRAEMLEHMRKAGEALQKVKEGTRTPYPSIAMGQNDKRGCRNTEQECIGHER